MVGKHGRHGRLRHPFLSELLRSISSSWTRFLAIMAIVGLGVGFYAGLNMVGQDMRLAADIYYDGTRLYDLRVVSTLGLTESQVTRIAGLEGVEQAKGSYAADVMARINDKRYAMRIMSYDMDVARAGRANERGSAVESADDGYLNRLVLAEGTWPSSPTECLLCADGVTGDPVSVGDTVEVLYGTAELDGVLVTRSYTVSGFVHTSYFPSSSSMGYTDLGSGMIKQCVFVSPEVFEDDLPYTEVFVTVAGARERLSGSDAYQARVDEVAEQIEGLGLSALRFAEVKADAEEEYAEGKEEYEEGRREADEEFAEAAAKLADALAELEEGEEALAEGRRAYEEGAAELADARAEADRQLAAGRAKLKSSEQLLDDSERQLGMTQADIDAARAELAAKEQQLADAEQQLGMTQADIDAKREELAAGAATWEEQRAQLVQLRDGLATMRDALAAMGELAGQQTEPTDEQIGDIREKVHAAQQAAQALTGTDFSAQLPDELAGQMAALVHGVASALANVDAEAEPQVLMAQLQAVSAGMTGQELEGFAQLIAGMDAMVEQGDQSIAEATAQLDQAQAARTEIDNGRAAIAQAKAQLDVAQTYRSEIDAGRAQLAAGWRSYYQQKAQAEGQLADAQQELDDAAAEIASSADQLADGRREYEEGLADYHSSRAEVEDELADAAAQLAAARADIDELEEPSVYVLDRTTNIGVAEQHDDSHRIDSIASVFPLMFFLVAALVSLTTMTRMVDDERIDIGTHKALGFSTSRITAKYVAYAAIAGLAGSVLFIVVLSQMLPWVVQTAYNVVYCVPTLPFPMPIDMGKVMVAVGIGMGVTIAAIYWAAGTTLREAPAALLLPRAPKAGKRILLERVGFVWSRVSFSWKVTFRNLFRYKQRLVMTVVGVAGCTALLLTGFGLHDAIWDIIDGQYEGDNPISRNSVTVGLKEGATTADMDGVESLLTEVGDASAFMRLSLLNKQLASESHDDALAIRVLVVSDYDALADLVDLRDRRSGEKVAFGPQSVVLTEKMANRLGVRVGDSITLYDQDEIGNRTGEGRRFVLTGITENYVYSYLYIGMEAWRQATGEVAEVNSIMAQTATDADSRAAMAEALASEDAVSYASFNTEAINLYRTSLKAVNMVVVVLVVAAALLAFIVLYNLTNIQLIERMREIASLKVLGFNRREVASYLFRETMILVCVGALLGLAAGTVLEGFVVVTAEVDVVMFGREIHPLSYLISFGLTLVFALVVMVIIAPKLHKVDMVESLKSVD